ncbi:MAG: hypothetical protein ACREIF_16385 [Chthoniobacterales bacterium]
MHATSATLPSRTGYRLEPLRGRWTGFHAIRVNDHWRIVFRGARALPLKSRHGLPLRQESDELTAIFVTIIKKSRQPLSQFRILPSALLSLFRSYIL